ncbi:MULTISPECIES: hypothetical protein [Streptomyces]|uniref:Uncharacterized protein n=1 Tax=Streptomyces sp. 900129855 TaxID=3155129 RepID=A0ABV2ZGI9_9ACTN
MNADVEPLVDCEAGTRNRRAESWRWTWRPVATRGDEFSVRHEATVLVAAVSECCDQH